MNRAPARGDRSAVARQQNSNWTTFSGDNTGQRHSPLTQMTPKNVAGLVPQWMFQTDVPGFPGRGLENSPLVVDGVAYVTGNNNQAWALDARTGRPIWMYRADASAELLRVGLLRARQSRLRAQGRPALHGHARRASSRARSQDGRGDLGCRRRRPQERQRHHGGAARREEPRHHRRRRRRFLEPRLHRRVRRARRARASGASTRFPTPASRAASRGRMPKSPRAAARPPG